MNAASGLSNCSFGVSLVTPVDNHRLVERALKYGILFIVLLFTAFFLFETLARLRIHPLQYLLVGAALCIFYLVLLALSELLAFWGGPPRGKQGPRETRARPVFRECRPNRPKRR